MWTKPYQIGFTIVELLIVIVVIAILAATTIVAYNGIQNRGYDSSIQSDLSVLKKKLELRKVDTGTYIEDVSLDFKASKNAYAITPTTGYNLLLCRYPPNMEQFKAMALSKSGNKFIVSNTSGVSALNDPWLSLQSDMCLSQGAPAPGNSNSRGYAADDLTTGPWRSWTGGN